MRAWRGVGLLLAMSFAFACGSVASPRTDAGALTGGAGTAGRGGSGGSGAAGAAGTGGGPGGTTTGGSATGGRATGGIATGGVAAGGTGMGGASAAAGGEAAGGGKAGPTVLVGHIVNVAASQTPATASMKVASQSLTSDLGRSCGASLCVSGGIVP